VADWADSRRRAGSGSSRRVEKRASRTLYSSNSRVGVVLQVAQSSNMSEPFDDLDVGGALIGSAGLVAFLLRHEIIHIPVGEGDFVLILLAQELFLREGGWGELGEGVAQSLDAAVGEGARDLGWSERIVVAPGDFGGDGTGVFGAYRADIGHGDEGRLI